MRVDEETCHLCLSTQQPRGHGRSIDTIGNKCLIMGNQHRNHAIRRLEMPTFLLKRHGDNGSLHKQGAQNRKRAKYHSHAFAYR